MREFVIDGVDGLIVDPTNVDALAMAISRVLTDEVLAQELSAHGARRVKNYQWSVVASRYAAKYDEIVKIPVGVAANLQRVDCE